MARSRSARFLIILGAVFALALGGSVAATPAAATPAAADTTHSISGVDSSPVAADLAIPNTGSITGHVTLGPLAVSAGAGQVAVTYVCTSPQGEAPQCSTSPSAPVYTDASGNYTIGGIYRDGTYLLEFSDALGDTYQSAFYQLTVTDTTATYSGINTNLYLNAVISGVVSLGVAGNTAPAGAVTVTADGSAAYSTTTAADGSYSIRVPAGSVRLSFTYTDPTQYATSWFVSATSSSSFEALATPLIAASAPLPGNNVTMLPPASISGSVTRSDGSAVNESDQWVIIDPQSLVWLASGQINADGTYHLAGLTPGNYEIKFNGDGVGNDLSPTYVGATVANPTHIRVVSVATGQIISDANAVQFQNASVTLNQSCTNCTTANTPWFFLQRKDESTSAWVEYDANGYEIPYGLYTFPILPPGTYRTAVAAGVGQTPFQTGAQFALNEGASLTVPFVVTIPWWSTYALHTLPLIVRGPSSIQTSTTSSAGSVKAYAADSITAPELRQVALSSELELRVKAN